MPDDVAARKAAIREDLLARRAAISTAERAAWSAAIAERVRALDPWRRAETVHAYVGALPGEVETRPLIEAALAEGKRVVCPRVAWRPARLEHYAVQALAELVENERGLWEPDPARAAAVEAGEIDLVLVPGLAFDRAGRRLGLGAGFYDRFLGVLGATPKIALAFNLQVIDQVPTTVRDVSVDWIVTESQTIDCEAPGGPRDPTGEEA